MTSDQVARLQRILDTALADGQLTPWAGELLAIDPTSPDAPAALRAFHTAHVGDIADAEEVAPVGPLAKCMPIDRFVMYYCDPDVRAEYAYGRPRDDYEREVATAPDPADRLTRDLPRRPDDLLVRADHSWMIDADALDGLAATDVVTRLRLRALSPLVRLDFPLDDMIAGGVAVRTPCAIDTFPALDDAWIPGAVDGEVIDRDIRRAACSGATWLP